MLNKLRDEYELDKSIINMCICMLAPHSIPMQEIINNHSKMFNKNPFLYYRKKEEMLKKNLSSAGKYLGEENCENIAFTESTTMGLSVIYNGIRLEDNDEIITTNHEHYSLDTLLNNKCLRSGCTLSKVDVFSLCASEYTEEYLISSILNAITDKTRIIALSWVYSCNGIKFPINKLGKKVDSINKKRKKKIIIIIDAVHALGVEDFNSVYDLHIDFLISGIHKWILGPRGSGIIWGKKEVWREISPTIPSFDEIAFLPWRKPLLYGQTKVPSARACSPGGFISYEHRWAVSYAFDRLNEIGKSSIKIHILNLTEHLKNGLLKINNVILHTPKSADLSSGLVCFEINGHQPEEVVESLLAEGILIGQTPYKTSYLRIAPSILNDLKDINSTVNAINTFCTKGKTN